MSVVTLKWHFIIFNSMTLSNFSATSKSLMLNKLFDQFFNKFVFTKLFYLVNILEVVVKKLWL